MSDTPPEPPSEPPEPTPEPEPQPEPLKDPAQVLADNRRLGRESAAAKKELKAAMDRIAEMEKAQMTDLDRRIVEERVTAADEERAKWLPVVRELTLAQAAVGKVAEPSLVGQLLANDEIDVTDQTAVNAAIDALIEKHPSLAAGPTQRGPSFDQGPRNGNVVPPKTLNDQLFDVLGIKRGP